MKKCIFFCMYILISQACIKIILNTSVNITNFLKNHQAQFIPKQETNTKLEASSAFTVKKTNKTLKRKKKKQKKKQTLRKMRSNFLLFISSLSVCLHVLDFITVFLLCPRTFHSSTRLLILTIIKLVWCTQSRRYKAYQMKYVFILQWTQCLSFPFHSYYKAMLITFVQL